MLNIQINDSELQAAKKQAEKILQSYIEAGLKEARNYLADAMVGAISVVQDASEVSASDQGSKQEQPSGDGLYDLTEEETERLDEHLGKPEETAESAERERGVSLTVLSLSTATHAARTSRSTSLRSETRPKISASRSAKAA